MIRRQTMETCRAAYYTFRVSKQWLCLTIIHMNNKTFNKEQNQGDAAWDLATFENENWATNLNRPGQFYERKRSTWDCKNFPCLVSCTAWRKHSISASSRILKRETSGIPSGVRFFVEYRILAEELSILDVNEGGQTNLFSFPLALMIRQWHLMMIGIDLPAWLFFVAI